MSDPAGPPPLPSNPDENAGPQIFGAVLSTTILAFVVAMPRFYVRAFMIKALGWDDLFMAFALALSIATTGVILASVRYGAGQHIGDVEPHIYKRGMKLNFISQPMLQWGVCVVKLSVGCALLRIATKKPMRWTIIGIMVLMTCYTVGTMTTLFTQCEQVAMQWDPSIPRVCWAPSTLQALAFTHAALNILTDFIFAVVIPIPILWALQMNRRTKAAVMIMLSLGIFVCLAGILRVPTIVNYGKAGDFLWDSRGLSIWFVAEFNTGIVAGSMPALKPIFKFMLDSAYFKGLTRRYGYGTNTGTGGAASNQRSFTNKVFSSNRDKERLSSHDQFHDLDGTGSQRGLVLENKPIPLGAIQKDVTTTITQMDGPSPPNTRKHAWDD